MSGRFFQRFSTQRFIPILAIFSASCSIVSFASLHLFDFALLHHILAWLNPLAYSSSSDDAAFQSIYWTDGRLAGLLLMLSLFASIIVLLWLTYLRIRYKVFLHKFSWALAWPCIFIWFYHADWIMVWR